MTPTTKRMAARNAMKRQVTARRCTVNLQSFQRICRAGRLKPARTSQPRAEEQTVDAHRAHQDALRTQKVQGQHLRVNLAGRSPSTGALPLEALGSVLHAPQRTKLLTQRSHKSCGQTVRADEPPKDQARQELASPWLL